MYKVNIFKYKLSSKPLKFLENLTLVSLLS